LGVQEGDGVELAEDGSLLATYGRFRVRTPLENIDHTVVTGPHQWYKAVGLRLSLTDDGLTFGTNHYLGLSIAFRQKIPSVVGPRDHSTLWVSVSDPAGLAAGIGR
jgi:hypothetical protein